MERPASPPAGETSASPAAARRLAALLGPPALLTALWLVALHAGPTASTAINDLGLYREDGMLVAAGHWPYREFLFEYPPLAIVPMWLGRLAGSGAGTYETVFGLWMLAAALGAQAAVRALARPHGAAAAWAFALAPLAAGAMLRTYFDLVPVALLIAGVLALARGRSTLAFAVLGAGTMTKGFPALGILVAAAWLVGRGEGRAALRGCLVAAGVVLALSLPFLSGGYVDAYRFQLDRPVQIESIPASVLRIAGGSHATGVRTPYPNDFRSNALEGGAEPAVAAVFALLELATLALILLGVARTPDLRGLTLGSCAAALAFIALGKVFSPQYAIWLVPWAALAFAWRERALAATLTTAIVLTQVEFPHRYWDLVAGDAGVATLVAARNAMVLVALALSVRRLLDSDRRRCL